MALVVRLAESRDEGAILGMFADLWPKESPDDHREHVAEILSGKQAGVYPCFLFVAEIEGNLAGFAEVSLRSVADGCDHHRPVGYLEGWFVAKDARRKSVGAALMRAAEDWARAQGCTEMGSDTWLDNEGSILAHQALGYEIVDRVVNFRKSLA